MEPMKKQFGKANFKPVPVNRCNATLGRPECSEENYLRPEENNKEREWYTELERINKHLSEKLNEQTKMVASILSTLEQQTQILAKHTVVMDRLVKIFFPSNNKFDIFPIRNEAHLEDIEKNLNNTPEEDLILYIKEIVGTTTISKCIHLFFVEDFLLKVNWDGMQKKIAVKGTQLFRKFVYEAVKNEKFGLVDYENAMKNGFRLAKNRFYKTTYNLKKN